MNDSRETILRNQLFLELHTGCVRINEAQAGTIAALKSSMRRTQLVVLIQGISIVLLAITVVLIASIK